jgi:hypothetical protein
MQQPQSQASQQHDFRRSWLKWTPMYAKFTLDGPITSRQISFLRISDSIHIRFQTMKQAANIIEGRSICIVNSFLSLTFHIPKQTLNNDTIIIVRDIEKVLEVLSDKK